MFCASTPQSMGHFVRLACLRHAASVHPEPGSNSPKKNNLFVCLICLASLLTFCSVFKDRFLFCCLFASCVTNISNYFQFVKNFFSFFLFFFVNTLAFSSLPIQYIILFYFLSTLFFDFLQIFTFFPFFGRKKDPKVVEPLF